MVAGWSRPRRLIRQHSFCLFKHRSLQLDFWYFGLFVKLIGCWARTLTIDKLRFVFVVVLGYVLLSSYLTGEDVT